MNELVSVIIPTYNYARYLGNAIESVISQTYSPVECIVVDDSSADDTSSVLESFGDRICAVTQPNGGQSNARNNGLSLAKGAYVAFLDADDWWEPKKIEKQVGIMQNNSQMMAVGCYEYVVDEDGNRISLHTFRQPTNDRTRNIQLIALRRLWIGGTASGILARRSVFDEIGLFDEAASGAEDWDMWMRFAAKYSFMNIPEPLNNRRRHRQGGYRNAERAERSQWEVYESAIQRWPEILNDKLRRQMRALILADTAGELIPDGHLAAARQKYKDSLREWPWNLARWKRLGILSARAFIGKQSRSSSSLAR